MIIKSQPKTFIIVLKDIPISEKLASDCLESAKKYNWDLEIFHGVNGNTITPESWNSIGVTPLLNKPSMNKPGTWGCFFSHFRLWELCVSLDEPIVVLEHDAVIKNYWPIIEINNSIVKLHRRYKTDRIDETSGIYTKSTHAYCILPDHCKKLIAFSKSTGAFATDAMMGSNVVPVIHYDPKGTSLVDGNHIYSTTQQL